MCKSEWGLLLTGLVDSRWAKASCNITVLCVWDSLFKYLQKVLEASWLMVLVYIEIPGSKDCWTAEFIDAARFRLGSKLTSRNSVSHWNGRGHKCLFLFVCLLLQVSWKTTYQVMLSFFLFLFPSSFPFSPSLLHSLFFNPVSSFIFILLELN